MFSESIGTVLIDSFKPPASREAALYPASWTPALSFALRLAIGEQLHPKQFNPSSQLEEPQSYLFICCFWFVVACRKVQATHTVKAASFDLNIFLRAAAPWNYLNICFVRLCQDEFQLCWTFLLCLHLYLLKIRLFFFSLKFTQRLKMFHIHIFLSFPLLELHHLLNLG